MLLGGCSLLFDATDLTAGRDGDGLPGSGSSWSGATAPSVTSGGGEGGVRSTGGGDPGTTVASSAGPGGGHGGGGATGGGSAGGGGGGACGPRFCETIGADAAFCFDFDGGDPFAELEAWHPDSRDVTAIVETVEEPALSCPRAVASRIEEVASGARAFAFIGFDVPQGSDAFVWSFAVQRITTQDDTSSNTIAQMSWESGETPCQLLVQMRDISPTEGRVSVYTQGHDGSNWLAVGSRSLTLPQRTLGRWAQVEVDVDLDVTGTITIRADGVEGTTPIDAMCGPSSTHYDLDIGHHFTNRVQASVLDDVTVRWTDG